MGRVERRGRASLAESGGSAAPDLAAAHWTWRSRSLISYDFDRGAWRKLARAVALPKIPVSPITIAGAFFMI